MAVQSAAYSVGVAHVPLHQQRHQLAPHHLLSPEAQMLCCLHIFHPSCCVKDVHTRPIALQEEKQSCKLGPAEKTKLLRQIMAVYEVCTIFDMAQDPQMILLSNKGGLSVTVRCKEVCNPLAGRSRGSTCQVDMPSLLTTPLLQDKQTLSALSRLSAPANHQQQRLADAWSMTWCC